MVITTCYKYIEIDSGAVHGRIAHARLSLEKIFQSLIILHSNKMMFSCISQ